MFEYRRGFARLLDIPFGRQEVTINIASAAALYKKLVTSTDGYVGEAPIIHQAVALKAAIDAMDWTAPFFETRVKFDTTVRWFSVGPKRDREHNGNGRLSGGRLCWRATCQGITDRKLIPMSPPGEDEPPLGGLRLGRIGIDFLIPWKTQSR